MKFLNFQFCTLPFLSVIFLGTHAFALRPVCFDKLKSHNLIALKEIQDTENNRLKILAGVDFACSELKNKDLHTSKSISEYPADIMAYTMQAMFGGALSAFSNLQNNETQMTYLNELNQIRQLKNRAERIRRVYELVSKTQGYHDYDSNGKDADVAGFYFKSLMPGQIINQAQQTGSGGVCRHFASLLQWSLSQVWLTSESRINGYLSENDFTSTIMMGKVTDNYGVQGKHVWVRLNLPFYDKNGDIKFEQMDLDSDWYPNFFALLAPRRSGFSDSEREARYNECIEFYTCILKKR